jgi:hypothetical protein
MRQNEKGNTQGIPCQIRTLGAAVVYATARLDSGTMRVVMRIASHSLSIHERGHVAAYAGSTVGQAQGDAVPRIQAEGVGLDCRCR